MKLINRKKELEFLERKISSKEAELLIIYGRRRIGKTELLAHFCKTRKHLYFMGRLEAKDDTIKRFNHQLLEHFNDKRLLSSPLTNWDTIFAYLHEHAEEKMLIIFDEFPFIAEKFPEIISVLQDHWDNKLRHTSIKFILCGSSISMMEKYTLDIKSPLYGRRTGQWKVDVMGVGYLKEFFPKYNAKEIINTYGCLDTIPGYLTKFDPEKSVDENIQEKIFTKGEFLYEEIEILLLEEFRDPSNYMSILASIAGGLTTFNEIRNKTMLDKSLLSKYIHILEKLGIIERIIPVTETYKAKLKYKGALYSLKDNFFNFWLRFVYVNKMELEKGNAKNILKAIEREREIYNGNIFEKFIQEVFPLLNIAKYDRIGRWWHKNQEIDIVALNEKEQNIVFGECKWQEKVDAIAIVNALQEKAAAVAWKKGNRKEIYAVFAKSFLRKINKIAETPVYCIDLKDIEKTLKAKRHL